MLTRRPIIRLRDNVQGAKRKSLTPHKLIWWPMILLCICGRWRKDDQKFQVIPGYGKFAEFL